VVDILLTNDDGYSSIAFYPLLRELSKHFSVETVAPSTEQSWIGKSLSRSTPLSLVQRTLSEFQIYSLNGTPADCVQIGLYDVLNDKPRLVVSGINKGLNTGHGRILSSGTVGAAMEASVNGVKSLSVSMHIPEGVRSRDVDKTIFDNAAIITASIVKMFIDEPFGESVDLLSVNIPYQAGVDTEIEITSPHRDSYGKLFHKVGGKYTLISPPINFSIAKSGTDLGALAAGRISVTPVSLALFSKKAARKMQQLFRDKKQSRVL
jgi:5'-nucleotidase